MEQSSQTGRWGCRLSTITHQIQISHKRPNWLVAGQALGGAKDDMASQTLIQKKFLMHITQLMKAAHT